MTKDDFLIRSRYGYVNLDYIEIMRLKQLFAYTAPSGYLCQMPGGEVKRVRSLHAALLRRRMIVRNSLLFLRQVHGELSEAQRESEVGLGEWPRDLFWNEGGFATSIMSLDPPKSFRRMDESEIDVEGVAYFTVSYVVFEREAREFSSSLSLSLSCLSLPHLVSTSKSTLFTQITRISLASLIYLALEYQLEYYAIEHRYEERKCTPIDSP